MNKITARIIALVGGCALDAVLGDPSGWPHPVRLIGKQIEFEERLFRAYVLDEVAALKAAESEDGADGLQGRNGNTPIWPLDLAETERLGGIALAFDVSLTAPLISAGAIMLCRRVHPMFALAAETALFYQLIAARSLQDESMRVYDALQGGSLEEARRAVSMIVGRDTDCLDEEGVARATVETIAENTSDGVIAPLLFMGAAGVPGAMFYKAVNTLDSMVGYKNEKYRMLGWAAAKLDDVANIVPSRVAGVLMCAASHLEGLDGEGAWRVFKRDRYNHASPNSAQTEAACAGALGVQLGGPNRYFGDVVDKPTIGDATRAVEAEDIPRANRLMYATALLGIAVATGTALLSIGSRGK